MYQCFHVDVVHGTPFSRSLPERYLASNISMLHTRGSGRVGGWQKCHSHNKHLCA
jgi:hypothetical protein